MVIYTVHLSVVCVCMCMWMCEHLQALTFKTLLHHIQTSRWTRLYILSNRMLNIRVLTARLQPSAKCVLTIVLVHWSLHQQWSWAGGTGDERLGYRPHRCNREHIMVKDQDERRQEELVVYCFSVCGGGALLGGLLGLTRSMEREFLRSLSCRFILGVSLSVFAVNYCFFLSISYHVMYSVLYLCVC